MRFPGSWTPEGDLLLDMEKPGEGPGEFRTPLRVEPGRDGFSVHDTRRFTFFAHDGTLLHTVPNPPSALSFHGFRLEPHLLTKNGGYLAVPSIPGTVMAGWTRDDPFDELPVLHVLEACLLAACRNLECQIKLAGVLDLLLQIHQRSRVLARKTC